MVLFLLRKTWRLRMTSWRRTHCWHVASGTAAATPLAQVKRTPIERTPFNMYLQMYLSASAKRHRRDHACAADCSLRFKVRPSKVRLSHLQAARHKLKCGSPPSPHLQRSPGLLGRCLDSGAEVHPHLGLGYALWSHGTHTHKGGGC